METVGMFRALGFVGFGISRRSENLKNESEHVNKVSVHDGLDG